MLLKSATWFMASLQHAIKNMAWFKYVQDGLARSKIKKNYQTFSRGKIKRVFFHIFQRSLEGPGAPKSWPPLHSSLQSYVKLFYKYIGYYVIDRNNNNDT